MKRHALLPTLILLAVLAGCAGDPSGSAPSEASPSTPESGGTLVVGSMSDVKVWNEYLGANTVTLNTLRRIYLKLAQELGDSAEHPSTFEPSLAASWDESEDGTALTFHLRDARWSDGEPITADDVVFTWRAQTSEEVPWAGRDSKAHITQVEVIDDRTVRFDFDRAYPYRFADAVEGGILPEHVFGKVPFAEWATHDWSAYSIGSGPFVLESHKPGHEVVLQRNSAYSGSEGPYVDRLVIRVVPEIHSLVTQLQAGDIDYVDGIPPRDAERLAQRDTLKLISFDHDYAYIGWNGSAPPFNDPELRRAMTLAIDREALVEDLLYGFGRVSKGPVLSDWWGADRDITPWPYDPDEARRILKAHGYDESSPLRFELMTNAGNSLREEVLVKTQEQLSRVGVEVQVAAVDMGTLMQRAFSGEYAAYVGGWSFTGKVDLGVLFASDARPPAGYNIVGYRSSEIDGLLDKMQEVASWREMKPHLAAIQRRIHEDQPYTFLYESKRIAGVGPRVQGMSIENPADPFAAFEQAWIRP
ncbi:MAG: hypothetical protein GY716_05550 [bacterium]|nr:hypothetical protein [bacterium]